MSKLFTKLDALSNFHFTPKPVRDVCHHKCIDMRITDLSLLPRPGKAGRETFLHGQGNRSQENFAKFYRKLQFLPVPVNGKLGYSTFRLFHKSLQGYLYEVKQTGFFFHRRGVLNKMQSSGIERFSYDLDCFISQWIKRSKHGLIV